MPFNFTIDRNRRLVAASGWGVFTEADAFCLQQAVWSQPDVTGYDALIDMSSATEIAIARPSNATLQTLAEMSVAMDTHVGIPKLAIVAPDDLAFALGRMYQAYRGLDSRSARRVEVFRTLAEGLAFLGHETVELPVTGQS